MISSYWVCTSKPMLSKIEHAICCILYVKHINSLFIFQPTRFAYFHCIKQRQIDQRKYSNWRIEKHHQNDMIPFPKFFLIVKNLGKVELDFVGQSLCNLLMQCKKVPKWNFKWVGYVISLSNVTTTKRTRSLLGFHRSICIQLKCALKKEQPKRISGLNGFFFLCQ